MRAADLVIALTLIVVGTVVIADALRLGIGWGLEGPQSGFFPSAERFAPSGTRKFRGRRP